MVERTLGDLQFVQNVLNRHLIEAFGVDQPLGYVKDFFTLDRVGLFFDGARHDTP